MQNGIVVIIYCCIVILIQQFVVDQLFYGILGKIRINRTCPISQKRRKMMHLPGLSGFQNNGKRSSFLCLHQVLMHCRHCQKRRDRHMVFINPPVTEHQNIGAVLVSFIHFHKQPVNGSVQTCTLVIRYGNHNYLKAVHFHIFDLQHICVGQNGIIHFQHLTVFRPFPQQVPVFPYIHRCAGHDLLPDGIDRRISNLRKQLLKIVEQGLMLFRKHCKRCICSHCRNSLRTVPCHTVNRISVLFIGIPKSFLHPGKGFPLIFLHADIGDLQIMQLHQITVQPLTVRLFSRINFL